VIKKAPFVFSKFAAPRLMFDFVFLFCGFHCCFFTAILFVAGGCATKSAVPVYPETSALPSQTALPDPLVMLDGRRVSSPEQWFKERRPELKGLFAHYMYGTIPQKPTQMRSKVVGEYRDFLGGKATLKLVRLELGGAFSPQPSPPKEERENKRLGIDLMLSCAQ
jgi:hypothetical protein